MSTVAIPVIPTSPASIPSKVDQPRVQALYEQLLEAVGLPDWRDSPHMAKTPERAARMWAEFMDYDPGNTGTVFPVEQVDQMVMVSHIDVWSLCAHHLLPFSARVMIGYIANEEVLGLSKFARIAQEQAHRPTSQEELCARIADEVTALTGAQDVAVTASGLHLCMAMRGIKTSATMTTSVTRGQFREDGAARAEWLTFVSRDA